MRLMEEFKQVFLQSSDFNFLEKNLLQVLSVYRPPSVHYKWQKNDNFLIYGPFEDKEL